MSVVLYSTVDGQNTGVVVKAGACELSGWWISNAAASPRYVKLYQVWAGSAPAATDTPVLRLMIPAGLAGFCSPVRGGDVHGLVFPQLGIRVTTGAADNDDTGPTTDDVAVNLFGLSKVG